MINEEYNKILKQYHKLSDRHILVVETDMPYSDVLKVVALSDRIRKAGNELVSYEVSLPSYFHDERIMTSSYVQKDAANYCLCIAVQKIKLNVS